MAESSQPGSGLYYTPCLPEPSASVTPSFAPFNQTGFVVHDVNPLSYISGFGMLPTSSAGAYAAYTPSVMGSHYIPAALAATAPPPPQVVYDFAYQHQEIPNSEPKSTMDDNKFYNRTNEHSHHKSFQKRPPERNKGISKYFVGSRNSQPLNVAPPLSSKENGPKFHPESKNSYYQQRWNDHDHPHSSNHHQNYWDQEQRKYSPGIANNPKTRNWKEPIQKTRHYNRVWRNNQQSNNTVSSSDASNSQRDNVKVDMPKEMDHPSGVSAKDLSHQNLKQVPRNDYQKKTNNFGSGPPPPASPGPPPAVSNHSQLNYRLNPDQFSSHNQSSQYRNSETEYRSRGKDSARDYPKHSEEWWGRSQQRNKYKYVSQERDFTSKNQKKPTREINENKNASIAEAVAPASNPDDENQRDSLSEQLRCRKYECMVCCCLVYPDNGIWSCSNCYNIFHLRCIKKWALSPAATCFTDNKKGWRCPVCQMVRKNIPHQYRCFCGKTENPQWNHYDTPHCCGEPCRKRRNENCPHLCTILCHPGPCPPCSSNALRKCVCGKKSQVTKCGQNVCFQCTEPCGKLLECKKHSCQKVCHAGSCPECEVILNQKCYGGHTEKYLACQENFTEDASEFSCGQQCKKLLSCGNHECQELCHNGDCPDCPLLPSNVTHCPCGQTPFADQSRTLCTDPVATCDKICSKTLPCGPADNHHLCQQKCHNGPCGPCKEVTYVRCRCKIFEKDFPCAEALKFNEENPFLCEKRCNKKRNCGKHKCSQPCCVRTVHDCERECRNLLTCGLHRCERPCHRGNCPPCLLASFEELTCYCGAEVIHPPVPCGTKPPECSKLCTKPHACDHPVHHKCNSDDQCPPCTVLTSKLCMGGHELRRNIHCHINDVSCGMPCNKDLPCVQHRCKKTCHKGPCQAEGESCNQPCQNVRPACGHPCNVPCHPGSECPRVACKSQISVKCPCGYRSASIQCLLGDDNITTEFSKITLDDLKNMSLGNDVDITKFGRGAKSGRRQLDCNEECSIRERNRRMALALEIKNPDLSSKLGNPPYSQFLKDFAKQHSQVVTSIEKSLSDLVQSTKQTKQNYKSHSFPPMNKEQRKVVHELAEHYGCQTEAYDMEPNRNVVAIARKDKCWLPSVTLTAMLQKDRKVPPPITHLLDDNERRATSSKQGCVVLNKMSRNSTTNATTTVTTAAAPPAKPADKPIIDYFDMS